MHGFDEQGSAYGRPRVNPVSAICCRWRQAALRSITWPNPFAAEGAEAAGPEPSGRSGIAYRSGWYRDQETAKRLCVKDIAVRSNGFAGCCCWQAYDWRKRC